MKPLQVRLIWFLMITKLHTIAEPTSVEIFTESSDLFELCPYTSFCGQNASSAFPFSEEYQPCCRPCSCDPDCGFHGDCCFSHLDYLYTEKPTAVCRSAFEDEIPEKEFPEASTYRFRMIDACQNTITGSKMNETACEKPLSDPSKRFYPVVSMSTKFVYINEFCALCNNVSDTVPWRQAVTCTPGSEVLLSEYLKNPNSVAGLGCYLYYIPPEGLNISPSPSCSAVVVRNCTNQYLNQSSKNVELCERFNATFAVRMNYIERLYANIYCYLCNIEDVGSSRPEIQNKHCLKFDDLNNFKLLSESRLTVLLDTENINLSPVTQEEETSVCPKNSVLINSFQKKCRQILCPWGQILLNNRCGYYSKTWMGGPFSVLLRLSPVENKTLIPSSLFHDLPESFRIDTYAQWIKRKSLRRWKFLVLYHPYEHKPAVEYLVVRATYQAMSVDPNNLNRLMKRALRETWNIHYLNSRYDLSVNFDEHTQYDFVSRNTLTLSGINITEPFGCFPRWVFCERLSVENNHFNELLLPFSTFTKKELSDGLVISKLFLCDQVDLLHDEYDNNCTYIHFRVKNTTIHTFGNVKYTGGGVLNESTKAGVRVCLHEFEHTQNDGKTKTILSILVLASAYVSINNLISM